MYNKIFFFHSKDIKEPAKNHAIYRNLMFSENALECAHIA